MFPLSFLALKYSYFRRGKKKSVTAAYRGKGRRKRIVNKSSGGRERDTDGVRKESKEINESKTGWRGVERGRPETSAVDDVLL